MCPCAFIACSASFIRVATSCEDDGPRKCLMKRISSVRNVFSEGRGASREKMAVTSSSLLLERRDLSRVL